MRSVRSGQRPVRGGVGVTRTLLAGVAAGVLLLAACSEDASEDPDDDVTEDVTDDEDPDTDLEDPDDDPADDPDDDPAEPDVDAEDGSGEDDAAGDDGEFDDVLAELRGIEPSPTEVTYQVTYSGPQGGGADQQMVTATDPPRTATVMDSPEGTAHTIIDQDADEMISCFQMGGQWQCTLMTGALAEAEDLLAASGAELPDLGSPQIEDGPDDVSYESILDRDAVCLHYRQMDEATDVRTCLDQETGVMLRTSSEGSDGFDVVALEFSTDPDPTLFEPPAEPVDMGDLGDRGDLGDLDLEDLDLEDLDLEDLEGLDPEDLEGLQGMDPDDL